MTWWKITLTWPYLLLIYWKAGSMTKKVLKDPKLIPESKRYIWLQKKVKYIKWLYSVTIKAHNIENWPQKKGCVLVVNHQSNFDALILLVLNNYEHYAPLGFIAKTELKTDRIASRFVFLIDVLFLDRKNPRTAISVFNEAKELLRIPRTMVIFPEGTRSNSQEMGDNFKPGALDLAYRAYVPILPVSIINSYQVFSKKHKGKKIIHVTFHPVLEPQEFINVPKPTLAKNLQKQISQGIETWATEK